MYTPTQQKYKDAQKKSRKAKELALKESIARNEHNAMYWGKSSIVDEANTSELNSWMNP